MRPPDHPSRRGQMAAPQDGETTRVAAAFFLVLREASKIATQGIAGQFLEQLAMSSQTVPPDAELKSDRAAESSAREALALQDGAGRRGDSRRSWRSSGDT